VGPYPRFFQKLKEKAGDGVVYNALALYFSLFCGIKGGGTVFEKDYYLVLFFRFVYDLRLSFVEFFHRNILTVYPSEDVELKLRDGEVYGNLSFELPTPEVKYTKENGVIAIDANASPIHLAIAEVSKTGELLSYQTISLHNLLGLSQNSKDHQEWILAHQIVDLAIQKGKAIAVENLKKLKKGMRGDGKATLRKILHN
jgi:hypothetical protein